MERADKGLAFMMQYENVAWYDSGQVRILDRRVYPRRVEFVTCRTAPPTDPSGAASGGRTAAALASGIPRRTAHGQ